MSYQERRKALKDAIDKSGVPMSHIVRDLPHSYNYVADVLRGEPGKVSAPVLKKVEAELDRRGIPTNMKV